MLKNPASNGHPGDGHRADQKRPIGDGQLLAQSAHLAHVLLATDMAWITEPEPRNSRPLKKAWVTRWKIADRIGPHTGGQEHVAQLGDRRIGQDLLDVGLSQRDRGSEDRRQAPTTATIQTCLGPAGRRVATGPPCRRPRSPWWRRGSGPRPASGPPSRRAARRRAESARSYRWLRQTGRAHEARQRQSQTNGDSTMAGSCGRLRKRSRV